MDTSDMIEDKIKNIVLGLGADLCGITNIERFTDAPAGFHPRDIYKDCKSVVVFARCLPKGTAFVNPRIIYGRANDLSAEELDRVCNSACREIERLGAIAVPIPSDSPYEYWDSDRLEGKGLISMKHAAVLAGLGSLGKSTLLINEEYGNMITIGALLTNLELKSDPLSREMCFKNCRLCIDNCPQKAINGQTVNQKLCREYAYGSTSRGFSTVNCNRCRVICPRAFGKREISEVQ